MTIEYNNDQSEYFLKINNIMQRLPRVLFSYDSMVDSEDAAMNDARRATRCCWTIAMHQQTNNYLIKT